MRLNKLKEIIDAEIKAGHGDRLVWLTSDDEGNDVHELFYGFDDREEVLKLYDLDKDKHIILG